ncbi:ParA family protein [Vagococcus fluvialis]|uniref:ParA family protein n=1 Tax=Vagococcus fluvialis TaxID=2738 RepID=A0A7X6DB00_9ENTE|nr:ParA family protein [Vagococcus fluvialis]NKC69050.1 ParA family protein [Vagococcus fluvialis]
MGNIKVVSFSAEKGGAGKTQGAMDFAEFLAFRGHKVALLDLDFSINLTTNYNVYNSSGLADNIFNGSKEKIELIDVKPNLKLIPGSTRLQSLNNDIQNKPNKDLLLFMWLMDNEGMFEDIEYLIIDTHNDFSTITRNAIAISNVVFSPIEPTRNSIYGKTNMDTQMEDFRKELVDPITRISYVNAKIVYYLNKIKHNTKVSRQLVEDTKNMDDVVAIVQSRELLNKMLFEGKTFLEAYQNKDFPREQKFIEDYMESLEKFKSILDNA